MTARPDRHIILRRATLLELVSLGLNLTVAVAAFGAGAAAHSIALADFGLDSLIAAVAAATLLWRLSSELHAGRQGFLDKDYTRTERRALRIVGLTFFALAFYIVVEAADDLLGGSEAEESRAGIALAAATLVVMPPLAWLKLRLARRLKSDALAFDAIETWVSSYLSLVVLLSLAVHLMWGWKWADALAALIMLPVILKKGWESWREGRSPEAE